MTTAMKEYFVEEHSIVRKIWGNSDTILFIFAGAAAEFALNKAVDWLYYTGKLPADPLGRLFSTVSYARAIVFSEREAAIRTIEAMANIHANVERKRGQQIPEWAYRDVLFMLIDYSIRSYEILEHQMDASEKNEVFHVFRRLGIHMGLKGLPVTFADFVRMREEHLIANLAASNFTADLFKQYRKHLGPIRFRILIEAQTLVVPGPVRSMLRFRPVSLLHPLIILYKISRQVRVDHIIKNLILPARYKAEIFALDRF
jgi:uncharacterized protein (DUF2236 family)